MTQTTSAHQQSGTAPSAARFDAVVRAAVGQGLLGEGSPVAGFIDTEGVRASVGALHDAFAATPEVLHTFAAKACSLVPVLRLLADCGMGCEVASPGELRLAVEAGFAASRVVLDSPPRPARRSGWHSPRRGRQRRQPRRTAPHRRPP